MEQHGCCSINHMDGTKEHIRYKFKSVQLRQRQPAGGQTVEDWSLECLVHSGGEVLAFPGRHPHLPFAPDPTLASRCTRLRPLFTPCRTQEFRWPVAGYIITPRIVWNPTIIEQTYPDKEWWALDGGALTLLPLKWTSRRVYCKMDSCM